MKNDGDNGLLYPHIVGSLLELTVGNVRIQIAGDVRLAAPCKHELGPGGSPENAAGTVV